MLTAMRRGPRDPVPAPPGAMPRRSRGVRPPARVALPLLLACCLLPALAGCRSTRMSEATLFRRVQPAVAFEIVRDTPGVPILDLRPAEEFHGPLGHLPRARSLPLAEIEARPELLRGLGDETFLVYCRRDECGSAVMDRLRALGYEDAMLIEGGIEAWVAAGFATVGASSPEGHAAGHPRSPG